MSQFSCHGRYSIEVKQQILLIDGKGPFNKELVSRYRKDLGSAISQLSGSQWGQYVVLHEMSLMTDDAEQEFQNSLRERMAIGLVASAFVVEAKQSKALIERQFSKQYQAVGLDFLCASTEQEAMAWLSQRV